MTLGQHTHDRAFDDVVLTLDGALHVGAQFFDRLLCFSDGRTRNKITHKRSRRRSIPPRQTTIPQEWGQVVICTFYETKRDWEIKETQPDPLPLEGDVKDGRSPGDGVLLELGAEARPASVANGEEFVIGGSG